MSRVNHMCKRIRTPFLSSAVFATVLLFAGSINAQSEFLVTLTGGTRFNVQVAGNTIEWTNIGGDGTTSSQTLKLSDIQLLELTGEPASEQVAHVRRLITQLGGPDFSLRESAEAELSKEAVGGPFRTLLELNQDDELFEVRYRIERILKQLKNAKPASIPKFDRVVLVNGTELEGDAGQLQFQCRLGNREFLLQRRQLISIGRALPVAPAPAIESAPPEVRIFHQTNDVNLAGADDDSEAGADSENDDLLIFGPDRIDIDFETNPATGVDPEKLMDLTNAFVSCGLRLAGGGQGYVGVSGYKFTFAGLPTGANSACVIKTSGAYPKRFKGIAVFSFCVPGQVDSPAGVHEFGVYVARCNHKRDFILEAYGADGALLATVESSDQPCPYLGVRSSEPIALLKILSNPYLFRIDRSIDQDYAFDNVSFSRPVPIELAAMPGPPSVRLNNGNVFSADRFEILDDGVQLQIEGIEDPFQLTLDEISQLDLGTADVSFKPERNTWLAMLDDRSLVRFRPGTSITLDDWPAWSPELDTLVAVGSARNPFRFPVAGDFENGQHVVVFPTCRMAADGFDLDAGELVWSSDSRKLVQSLDIDGSPGSDEEDPAPDFSSIAYDSEVSSDIPTLWMVPPPPRQPGTGMLVLRDGQQLTINGSSRFEITKIDRDKIEVTREGRTLDVPWERVRSLKLSH